MVQWDYKKRKGSAAYDSSLEILSWLFKSLKWCHRKMVVSMESKKKHYILLISHTNSEIRIDLPCNSTGLLPANKHT